MRVREWERVYARERERKNGKREQSPGVRILLEGVPTLADIDDIF